MTRKELEKFIEEEVDKLAKEPIREPIKEMPKPANIQPLNPALRDENEIDEYLFKAGMKEK